MVLRVQPLFCESVEENRGRDVLGVGGRLFDFSRRKRASDVPFSFFDPLVTTIWR